VKLTAENILYLDHCPILLSKFALRGNFTDGSCIHKMVQY
jgi:hypothetical protein